MKQKQISQEEWDKQENKKREQQLLDRWNVAKEKLVSLKINPMILIPDHRFNGGPVFKEMQTYQKMWNIPSLEEIEMRITEDSGYDCVYQNLLFYVPNGKTNILTCPCEAETIVMMERMIRNHEEQGKRVEKEKVEALKNEKKEKDLLKKLLKKYGNPEK